MSIVYIHGVAVRDHRGDAVAGSGSVLLDRLLQSITWEAVAANLLEFVAPVISAEPSQVELHHAYWGDLAAGLAWDGASCPSDPGDLGSGVSHPGHLRSLRPPTRSRVVADLRRPLNQLGAQFIGDVFSYLNGRGDETAPGPVPMRILDSLAKAQSTKERSGEPIVVLTNSMGGQIMYDIVTYFLPRLKEYSAIRVDFWCSVASQIGLFEEMKLFLVSSPEYGRRHGNRVPFPDRRHLGTWLNVWDVDDVISYSVAEIIEGVDDMSFRVGRPLLQEHIGYLQEDAFYMLLADHVGRALNPP